MDIVWQAEDSLREKKVESDLKDLLKTLVAFANSVAPGDTAKIFIGEKDDGTVQGVTNPDNIQKTVTKEAEKIYRALAEHPERRPVANAGLATALNLKGALLGLK